MTAHEVHDLLLRHARDTVEAAYLLFPRNLVDEGVDEQSGTCLVAFERVVVRQLGVVDDRGEQVVREVAIGQVVQLAEEQLLHLVEGLSFLRCSAHDKGRIVAQGLAASPCSEHLHLLVDVQVDESGCAVAEHLADDVEGVHLERVAAIEAPTHPQRLCFQSHDGGVAGSGEGLHGREFRLTYVGTGFPSAKLTVDDGDGLVEIEVASHTDGHVVGAIPVVEVLLDIGNRRILQVLLRTDGGLRAIGMGGEQHGADALPELARVLSDTDVVLLVDSFQLGVESADDHILETVGLDLSPVGDFVRGDVLHIARHVVRCVGIRSLCSDGRHQLVVLIGDEVLGGQLADGVDLVILLPTQFRVGDEAILLVACLDIVQQRGFGLGVGDTKLISALEHQVFQIVSQTRCLGRVVLRSCTHSDEGLDARLLLVDGEIHLQTVVEGVNARLRHIALKGLILVVFGLSTHSERQEAGNH